MIRDRLTLDSPYTRGVVGWVVLGIPLVLVIAFVEVFLGPANQQVAVTFLISLVAVVGFQVYSGNSGIMTFGHVAFMGIAAYVAGILTIAPAIKAEALPALPSFLRDTQLSLIPAVVVALLVVLVVAFAFGWPLTRLSAAATPISTLAMLMIVYVVLVGAADFTRGSQTFYGVPSLVDMWGVLIAALLAILIARLFRDSVLGLRLRASREDELASRSAGVHVANLRLTSWLLSALIVGLAGALLGFTLTAFSPKQFYFTLQFELVAMLVVGSSTTVSGAVGGTFLVSLLMEAARRVEAAMNGQVFGLQEITLALVILATMYWRRDGLFGLREADEILISWLRGRGLVGSQAGLVDAPAALVDRSPGSGITSSPGPGPVPSDHGASVDPGARSR
jgi:branched-chain amino acid transport system ATP-binding protein/branched-chain amino acid transport system permease protein